MIRQRILKKRIKHLSEIFRFNIITIIIVFLTTYIFGYIFHGQIIFNKLIYHDEVGELYGMYNSMQFGRWFIFLTQRLLVRVFDITSTNSFSVFFSFFFISISNLLLLDLFRIKKIIHKVLFCLISITNLAICSSFGYMFISIYLAFMIFTTSLSAYLIIKNSDNIFIYILSAIIYACSIGTNQAAATLFVNIFLFYYIINIGDFRFKKVLYPFFVFVFAIFIYIFFYKFYFIIKNIPITSYKNISSFGYTGVADYFNRIIDAVKYFVLPVRQESFSMYPNNVSYLYFFYTCLFIVLLIYNFIMTNHNKILLLFLMLLIPISVNAMFIIVGAEYVYALNLYNYVLVFLLSFVITEKHFLSIKKFKYMLYVLTILIVISLFKYIDVCYTNLFFKTQQAQSFGLTLISRIENTENYNDDYKVYFNENPNPYFNKRHQHFSKNVPFDDIVCTAPYGYLKDGETYVYNNYQFNSFNRVINGFNPKRVSYNELNQEQKNRLNDMPVYPDSGSIEVVDDVVLVKLEKD